MTRVAATGVTDAGAADALLAPRDGIVRERPVPGRPGEYVQAEGPLRRYHRRVRAEVLDGGRVHVHQEVCFAVGLPWFSPLFVLPLRRHLGDLWSGRAFPWWGPPTRLNRRAAVVLATACALMVADGYLDSVLTQTMTYAGAEFRVGSAGQGLAFGVVQLSAVLALVALAAADRRGRRPVLLGCLAGGAVLTAAGAVAPSLTALTADQVVVSSLSGAGFLLLFVVATEEMPAGARAWGAGMLSLCYGLGSGAVLLALPLAGSGQGGWRWVYALAGLGALLVARCARDLPESRRFVQVERTRRGVEPVGRRRAPLSSQQRRRLLALAAFTLLTAIFASPAGELHNQFLRAERHFSPAHITILKTMAGTIGGLGVLVGGRLADTRGRRPVAAAGVAVGTAVTVLSFLAHGWSLWAWAVVGSLLSYAVGPALAVYGPELFPTGLRGRASGVLAAAGAGGGLVGLAVTGSLASALGGLGPALGVLAVAPLAGVVVVVLAFPETAGRPLEALNPEDAPAPPASARHPVGARRGAGPPRQPGRQPVPVGAGSPGRPASR